MVLTHNYYQGVVRNKGKDFTELAELKEFAKRIGKYLEKYEFRNALMELMNLARMGNQFLQVQEPWKKTDQPDEVESTMYAAAQIAGMLAQLSEPFMPFTAEKRFKMMNLLDLDWHELEITEEIITADS